MERVEAVASQFQGVESVREKREWDAEDKGEKEKALPLSASAILFRRALRFWAVALFLIRLWAVASQEFESYTPVPLSYTPPTPPPNHP